ncbi:MAG: hypothetical protein ACKO2G_03265 [Verrucomicrobiales bacterium]
MNVGNPIDLTGMIEMEMSIQAGRDLPRAIGKSRGGDDGARLLLRADADRSLQALMGKNEDVFFAMASSASIQTSWSSAMLLGYPPRPSAAPSLPSSTIPITDPRSMV